MSGKVKLTREQADIIEKHKTEHLEMLKDMFENPQDYEIGKHEPLLELTAEKYHDALYIGYEIEETFKVGDWLHLHLNNEDIVREYYSSSHMKEHHFYKNLEGCPRPFSVDKYIRHATPEEIAEEKQRRWWAKHGREVWELKDLDILINEKTGKMYEVDILKDETIRLWKIGVDGAFASDYKSAKEISKNVEVFCFAEDRKDVDHA